jgi:hypothetical protein
MANQLSRHYRENEKYPKRVAFSTDVTDTIDAF